MNISNALNLLSAYGSDSDDEEFNISSVCTKRKLDDDEDISNKLMKVETTKLPSPSFATMSTSETILDDKHDGRIRTFPHERGNWATYIYISYEHNSIMKQLINEIIESCSNIIQLQTSEDLHISLTKTLILRHHWIDSFINTISNYITDIGPFVVFFDGLEVYCNEERTRTFLGLHIKSGNDTLVNIVNSIDKGLKEFNLPTFYEDPSFHMSLAWSVGDHEEIYKSLLDNFNEIFIKYMSVYPQSYWYIHVKKLLCKTGNKLYNLKLANNFVSK